jgi:hypothetical protein
VRKRIKLLLRRGVEHGGPGKWTPGPFAADVASYRLHLAAESKAGKTIRTYTEAAAWLNGWTSPQMLDRYARSSRAARARRTYGPHHGRHFPDTALTGAGARLPAWRQPPP